MWLWRLSLNASHTLISAKYKVVGRLRVGIQRAAHSVPTYEWSGHGYARLGGVFRHNVEFVADGGDYQRGDGHMNLFGAGTQPGINLIRDFDSGYDAHAFIVA